MPLSLFSREVLGGMRLILNQRSDGTYEMRTDISERNPSTVILIEVPILQVQTCRLGGSRYLVDVPVQERHVRLDGREADKNFLQKWHKRWMKWKRIISLKSRPKRSLI